MLIMRRSELTTNEPLRDNAIAWIFPHWENDEKCDVIWCNSSRFIVSESVINFLNSLSPNHRQWLAFIYLVSI